KKLANEELIFGRLHLDQHDGQVTGNAMRPQPWVSETVRGNRVRLSQLRIREDDRCRQPIEQDNVVHGQRHLAQLTLTPALGTIECPVDGLGIAELLGYL